MSGPEKLDPKDMNSKQLNEALLRGMYGLGILIGKINPLKSYEVWKEERDVANGTDDIDPTNLT